jgi:Pyruvate-formate lyase-activating enzyme
MIKYYTYNYIENLQRRSVKNSMGVVKMIFNKVQQGRECLDCKFCDFFINCPTGGSYCIGCGICLKGCPTGTRTLFSYREERSAVKIVVDGENYSVPSRITVAKALELLGKTEHIHSEALCSTGSCFNCTIKINGKPALSCHTEVLERMEIITDPAELEKHPSTRLVSYIQTPMHKNAISIFTHGCNLACDFCHNWDITFSNTGSPSTPEDAAFSIESMLLSGKYSRLGISGGEPTLNRKWLVKLIQNFRSKHGDLRIQVDTNASILTPDYIDELYEAGMTDISPDIKALNLDTYMKITGINNKDLAKLYLRNSWQALEYIIDKYVGKLYYIAAIPYHPEFMSGEELSAIGKKLYELDKNLDVNLVEYQPAFRAREAKELTEEDILEMKSIINNAGLERVWCQAGEIVPRAMDPLDLMLSKEFVD